MKPNTTTRRNFLRAAGVSLALPTLPSLLPRAYAAAAATSPKRMVLINASMGILPKEFFPKDTGKDYQPSPYMEILGEDLRQKSTVFSGLSHPEVDGGHHADICFLTGAPHPGGSGFRNTISLDQFAAERIGIRTRVPSLVLHAGPEGQKKGLSWTASGVAIPAESKPSQVYKRLFLNGSPAELAARMEELRTGRSILDAVAGRASQLEKNLPSDDREKVQEYFTSVRELEQRLHTSAEWEKKPKPQVDVPIPEDIRDNAEIVGQAKLMYQMAKLAIQTDSTRIITLKVHSYDRVNIEGVDQGHHSLTHHGGRPEALKKLKLIETARLREFRDFLNGLNESKESGGTLLNNTMVLYGSHMGDANRHSNDNLPILLTGGDFKHGHHIAFDKKHNTPLANLQLSMLQQMGVEADKFASSTGTLTGLEG